MTGGLTPEQAAYSALTQKRYLDHVIGRVMPRMRITLRDLALLGVSHQAIAAHFIGAQQLASALRKQEAGK